MKARNGLALGLALLLAFVGALFWLSKRTPVEPAPVVVSTSVAAENQAPVPPKPSLTSPGDSGRGEERFIAPPVLSPRTEPSAAVSEPEEPVEPPLLLPPGGALEKPISLAPLGGDAAAIALAFQNSTYETRFERLRVLEAALELGAPDDHNQMEAFAALKNELVWLREHVGKPTK